MAWISFHSRGKSYSPVTYLILCRIQVLLLLLQVVSKSAQPEYESDGNPRTRPTFAVHEFQILSRRLFMPL